MILAATAAAAVALTAQARAGDILWNNPAGGSFGTATNWNPQQVPGTGDAAHFTPGATYTVTLGIDRSLQRLLAHSGNVTLDLSTQKLTLNGSNTTPLIIGTANGENATLTVANGTLDVSPATPDYNLLLGDVAGSTGTLNFGAGASIVTNTTGVGAEYTGSEFVGVGGVGIVNQTGGSNTIGTSTSPQQLWLGYSAGSSGTYNLSGTGQLTVSREINIGGSGTGTFNQTGGVVAGSGMMYIGRYPSSSGAYNLSGTGQLILGSHLTLASQNNAFGTFTQNGGTVMVGGFTSCQGDGGIIQTAGTHETNGLSVLALAGHTTSYSLSGTGQLIVNQSAGIGGHFLGSDFSGTFSISDSGTATINNTLKIWDTTGTQLNLSGGTLSVGALDTDSNPSRFNWTGGTLWIAPAGGTDLHVDSATASTSDAPFGSSLSIGSGKTFKLGKADFTTATSLQIGSAGTGSMSQSGSGIVTLYGGLKLGTVAAHSGTYTMTGGMLSTQQSIIGEYGTGSFTQSAGTHTAGPLNNGIYPVQDTFAVAERAGSAGSYDLSGSGILQVNGSASVGGFTKTGDTTAGGSGVLNISGGSSMTVTGGLKVWDTGASSPGGTRVNFSGGTLVVGNLDARANPARFNWTGGTLQVNNNLHLSDINDGYNAASVGKTLAIGTGQSLIVSGWEWLYAGGSSITQTGGSNQTNNTVYIGSPTGAGTTATYTLSGGTFSSGAMYLGYIGTFGFGGPGIMDHTGGTHTVQHLWIGYNAAGTYNRGGSGLLNVLGPMNVGGGASGTFNHTGGTVTVGGLAIGQSASGSYDLSGNGVLTVNGGVNVGQGSGPSAAAGLLNISGGSMTVNGALKVWNSGAAAPDGTRVNLSGGTLSVGSLDISGNPARLSWTGGTLRLTGQNLHLTNTADPYNAAPFGNSLVLNSGQTLQVPNNWQWIYGAGSTLTQNGGSNSTLSLYIGNTTGGGAPATYTLAGGSLTANDQYIGYIGIFGGSGGAGVVEHTAGTNNVSTLVVAVNAPGTYNLSNAGAVMASSVIVGNNGTGILNIGGGTMTVSGTLAVNNTGPAAPDGTRVNLSGGTLTVGTLVTSGDPSRFNWTGGTLTLTGGSGLTIQSGQVLGNSITLTSGMNLNVLGGNESIGSGGGANGSFIHNGGTHTVGSLTAERQLIIGNAAGVGSYTMATGASLTVHGPEFLGTNFGTGTFTQSGGSHTVGTQLSIGDGGAFTLDGGNLQIGDRINLGASTAGTASFTQSGGTHTIGATASNTPRLFIASSASTAGTYTINDSDAALTINGNAYVGGHDLGSGGTGVMNISGGSATIAGQLKVWDTGAAAPGGTRVNLTGGALSVQTLSVPNAQRLNFSAGTLIVSGPGTSNVTGNLIVGLAGGTATFDQTGGTIAISGTETLGSAGTGHAMHHSSGAHTVGGSQTIAQNGSFNVVQSGGSQTVSGNAYLALNGGSSASYSLSNAAARTVNGNEGIAEFGIASFTQSGTSTHTVIGDEYMGDAGIATYEHTGGTHSVGAGLYLGNFAAGNGTYNLSGTAVLTAANEHVGKAGTGTFNQTGGTHTVTGTLKIATDSGSTGVYTLSGGTLNAPTLINRGTFNFNGGTMNVSTVQLNDGGSMTLGPGTNRVMKVSSLSIDIADSSKLDVNDNKVIIAGGDVGSWDTDHYTGVTGMIQSGRNPETGAWNGSGIITSMTDATTSVLTTLAIGDADELGYAGGTFGGVSVSGDDVLVMYTWGGDADMNGELNGDDYFFIDSNALNNGSVFGFHNGDFDYNGTIDGDDYFIIDSNITFAQASPPFPTGAGGGGIAPVPEPTALTLAAGATLLLRRRRSV